VAKAFAYLVVGLRFPLILAGFGLLALIPLEQFRQLAIIMAVGVMLDSVVVRSFLVPALVALTGRFGMWPGSAGWPRPTASPNPMLAATSTTGQGGFVSPGRAARGQRRSS
jgi:MMPL family